ncbi:glycosyltransferase family 9 protein [Candidatus Dependentiae bacterium]|nr:glycosyltransferase family 9 protein [Candidatus Dependentiae bacterium]
MKYQIKYNNNKSNYTSKNFGKKFNIINENEIKKICVIKFGGLGDTILTVPFFRTLRKYFPSARITFLCSTNKLISEKLVDDFIIIPRRKGLKEDITQIIKFRKFEKQDFLFDITESTRSMILSAIIPATMKVGFNHRGFERFCYDAAINRSGYKFESDAFLDLLRAFEINGDPLDFFMPEHEIKDAGPFVTFAIGSAMPTKNWPIKNYAELADKLINQYPDIKIVIPIGPLEKEIETDFKNNCRNLDKIIIAGPLEDVAGYLRKSLYFIGNDTGIRHIAIAYGVPTLGILMASNVIRYSPAYISKRHFHFSMSEITVDAVFNKTVEELEKIKKFDIT